MDDGMNPPSLSGSFPRTGSRMASELPESGCLCGFVRRNATIIVERAQVTVRVSPSTLIVFVGSGWGAGGLTTEPSVIEYLLP
jgi:hypothetical protein